MTPDSALVFGLILIFVSFPALISAWSDGRPPRASSLTLLLVFGLILFAVQTAEPGYTLAAIPEVILRVVASWLP